MNPCHFRSGRNWRNPPAPAARLLNQNDHWAGLGYPQTIALASSQSGISVGNELEQSFLIASVTWFVHPPFTVMPGW
jgi:hypothetical protein